MNRAPISGSSAGQLPTLNAQDVFALLDNSRAKPGEPGALLFFDPVDEVLCRNGEQLIEALEQIDSWRRQGRHCCGYVAYEAGYSLVDKQSFSFRHVRNLATPLLHFVAFGKRLELSDALTRQFIDTLASHDDAVQICDPRLSMSKAQYFERIDRIKTHLRDGDSYQVNFTLKYHFRCVGNVAALYRCLRTRQRVEFGALLNFAAQKIVSLSPELFLAKTGDELVSKPMKGTARRGDTPAFDNAIVAALRSDAKTRSENVMIVDLIRNDMGRIAAAGSVSTSNLFEIQTFETVHQMVSTVRGRVSPDISVAKVFTNLFPCGSITGAPKLRTMQIIEELETEPRGIYTGAIGYVGPENDFRFSVAIRTVVVNADGTAEMGIGSGITSESDPESEFQECLLKSRFLTEVADVGGVVEPA